MSLSLIHHNEEEKVHFVLQRCLYMAMRGLGTVSA